MKNTRNKNTKNGNTDTLGILGIAFIVLKLTDVIAWSWWWVTAPIWGGTFLALVITLLMLLPLKRKKSPTAKVDTPVKRSKFQEKLERMQEEKLGKQKSVKPSYLRGAEATDAM